MREENQTIIKALNMFGRVPETWELLNEIEILQQENERLNSRINKAIEYIKSIKYMNCRYFDYNKWRKNTTYGSIEELHEKIKKDGTLEGHFVEVNRDIIFNILNGGDKNDNQTNN